MAQNTRRLQWHEDTWHTLFSEGLLSQFLSFHHLPALARLSKSHLQLFQDHREAMWGSCCARAGTEELVGVLDIIAETGQAEQFKTTFHYLRERKDVSGLEQILAGPN